ncbi:hypothetical protein FA15DRAFT_701220 [Coprinopsis marcescibilis]|uniref:F-box domain-containing protein n=1 Tax=Coprinopsis marcescibilis TaxID=230819 RepID=A0A5C3L5P5_COPMA|nr:hypothetical protein FA15DRAFT_701220 [Coprinopsis marcescibilis]
MALRKLPPGELRLSYSENDVEDVRNEVLSLSKLSIVADLPRRATTTVHDLPVELLEIIFKIAHNDWLMFTLHPEAYSAQPTSLRARSWKGLMRIFCQFPYTPSAVCRHWRGIILDSPAFWTRPAVFVDGKDPLASLSNLRAYIQRSRDLPLILAVVRKTYNVPYDTQEALNVSLFMDVIECHLKRFHDIYFHLSQSSSLPLISRFRYQPRTQANLQRLALHCDADDGPNNDTAIPRFLPSTHWPPSLTAMKIDGRNFMTMCQDQYSWAIVLSRLKSLSIERLQHTDDTQGQLSLVETLEFLGKLPELEVLTIRDVEFCTTLRLPPGTPPVTIDVADLILEDLNHASTKALFDLANLNPTYVMLRNIPIDALPYVPQPMFLELADIAIDQDIEDLLCFWDGEVLAIRNCDGFNDGVLSLFADDEPLLPRFSCPSLRELHLQDCENFTGVGLRRMAETRMDLATRRVDEGFSVTDVADIFVSGGGPVLVPEDASWLRTNMKSFVWSTGQPSGGSCHLDPDSVVPFTVP